MAAQQSDGVGAPWRTPALSHVPTPSWLALSGEIRVRGEHRSGLGYVSGASDGYALVRTRLNVDVRPHALLRLSAQGQDARAPGMTNPSGVFRDPFDLRQAYVRVGRDEGGPVAVTVGRQLLVYADQRLIGPLDWTNTARAFDAAKLELRTRWLDLDVFASSVVVNDPTERPNESDFDFGFHGVYGRVRTGTTQIFVEPFIFWRSAPSAGAATGTDRYTAGARLLGRRGDFDAALTVVEQWGERGADEISARGVLASTGYTLGTAGSPRVYAEYNYASGDSDPADGTVESFDDMYPTAHLYYGYNDLVGLRNLHNVRVGASVAPWRGLTVQVDVHGFVLAERTDHLYNAGGAVAVQAPPGGASERRVGEELDVTFALPVGGTMMLAGGVGHLFPGPFLEAQSDGAGNTFTHLALTVRF